MRLFQQQMVYKGLDANQQPPPPPPPPFLPDEEEEKGLSLLRESTTHLREGRQRLPTPDRVAIMELSSSFEKRRLGKQQQILSEITQRCREQEVTDLSSKISAKVELKKTDGEDPDSPSLYAKLPRRKPKGRNPSLSTGDLRELEAVERRVNFEKAYKFFPARKIMRQPTRLHLFQATTTNTSRSSGGNLSHRDAGTAATTMTAGPKVNIDFLRGMRSQDTEARAQILERQTINGSIQLQHYIQPKLDAMAPLLLPDVHGMDVGYQDRIDSYFSSSRLALNQRSKTFFDTSSVSGRSYRSLHTGPRPTGSRHQMKSMRSDRGPPLTALQQINDDVGGVIGEVPMDLKSSAHSALRSESQKV